MTKFKKHWRPADTVSPRVLRADRRGDGDRPFGRGGGSEDRHIGTFAVQLAGAAPGVSAGHSGGPPEVPAVLGRAGIAIANGEPGNVQMTTLALKNRSRAAYGWHHDSQRVEHSGPDGAPVAIETAARNTIDVSRMSADDRDALRGILLRAGAREESQSKIGYSED
jgi:hypothetical protein